MVEAACQQQGIEQAHYRFSRREIRDHTGWSDGQLKIHCSRLTELEYLLVHRGGRGQRIVYELLYDGDLNDGKHLMGLIDPNNLRYDEKRSGQKAQKTASSQGQVRPKSGAGQGSHNNGKHCNSSVLSNDDEESGEEGYIKPKNNGASHHSYSPSLAAAQGT